MKVGDVLMPVYGRWEVAGRKYDKLYVRKFGDSKVFIEDVDGNYLTVDGDFVFLGAKELAFCSIQDALNYLEGRDLGGE